MRQVAPLTMWSDHLTIWPADQGVAPLLDLNIEPVLRTNLSQVVAEALLQLIRKGDLKPGDQLPPERELMRRFNVSRSTVREGLKSLAMVNVLDIQQGRGAIVKDVGAAMFFLRPDVLATLLSRSISEELFEARLLIEVGAIPLVAERSSDDELAEVEELLNQCAAALAKGLPRPEASARFHSLLLGCVHNSVLQVFMDSVKALLIERGAQLARRPGFSEWELRSHREILDAIKAHDVVAAQAAMREHLQVSSQALLSLLE